LSFLYQAPKYCDKEDPGNNYCMLMYNFLLLNGQGIILNCMEFTGLRGIYLSYMWWVLIRGRCLLILTKQMKIKASTFLKIIERELHNKSEKPNNSQNQRHHLQTTISVTLSWNTWRKVEIYRGSKWHVQSAPSPSPNVAFKFLPA